MAKQMIVFSKLGTYLDMRFPYSFKHFTYYFPQFIERFNDNIYGKRKCSFCFLSIHWIQIKIALKSHPEIDKTLDE